MPDVLPKYHTSPKAKKPLLKPTLFIGTAIFVLIITVVWGFFP